MNPIYTSELLKDDNIDDLIAQYKKLSDQFKNSISEMRQEAVLLNGSISQSNVTTTMQQDSVKKTAAEVEKLTAAYIKTKKELEAVNAKLKALTEAKKANNAASKAEEKVNQSVSGSLNNLKAQLALNKARLNEMTDAQKKNSAEAFKLQQQTERLQLRIAAMTREEAENIKMKKLQAIASKAAAGSFEQLSAQYQIMTIKLNKMSEEERKNTKAGQEMEAQSKRIYEEMKRLQAATGSNTLNVGNYSGALAPLLGKQRQLVQQLASVRAEFAALPRHIQQNSQAQQYNAQVVGELTNAINELQQVTGQEIELNEEKSFSFRNLKDSIIGVLAAYAGFSSLQEIGQQIFGQTKELDSLDKAYEKIIPNTQKLARANDFLGRLSDSYGLNLIKLRGEYLKYTASAQASTLSLKDQELVFESVAKASATLGLSTETQSRAFTALQEIMSKGKVSAEELKGQLGDALPGAVNIMARALGVGVGELSKMLEQGQVLADEALPKFAIELQKAYGVEGVSRIDNLSAAQSRFESEITKVIQKLDASGAFKDFFNTMAKGVKFIGDNIQAIFFLTKAVVLAGVAYGTWKASLALTNSLLIQNALGSVRAAGAQGLLNTSVLLGKKAMDALKVAFATNPIGLIVTVALTAAAAIGLFNDGLEDVIPNAKRFEDITRDTAVEIETEQRKTDGLFKAIKDLNNPMSDRLEHLEELKRLYPGLLDNIDLEKTGLEGLESAQLSVNDAILKGIIAKKKAAAIDESIGKVAEATIRKREIQKGGFDALTGTTIFGLGVTGEKGQTDLLGLNRKEGESSKDYAVRKAKEDLDSLIKQEQEYQKGLDQFYEDLLNPKSVGRGSLGGSSAFAGRNSNKTVGAKKPTGDDKKTDPYKILELQIAEMQDGYDKELALIKLNNQKKKDEFVKYGIDTKVLNENLKRDISALDEKYAKIETDKFDEAFKEKISYLEDGIEKEMTALYFEYSVKARTTKDKAALDKWYFAEYDKLVEKQNKEKDQKIEDDINKAKKAYDEELEFAALEFSLTKRTEEEKKNFAIEQEKLKLKKILELNKQFNGSLTDLQIKTIEAQIKTLDQGIKGYGSKEKKKSESIYDLLGINLSDEKKQAVTDSLQYAKDQLTDWAKVRTEIAQQNVDTISNEVSSLENQLQVEIENRNANRAHKVDTVTKELQDAKKAQEAALKERKKAQQQQLLIESVQQASSLVTASAKIWGTLGFPLAIPALGLMWGSFIASKVQAANLTKKAYGDGGYEEFDYGGSHQSGNDIQLGYTKDGKDRRVERGETMAIFNKRSVSKYGSHLKNLVSDINRGNLEKYIEDQQSSGRVEIQNNIHKEIIPIFAPSNDMRNVESELVKIRKQNEVKGATYFTDKNGNVIKQYKNLITRYV